jgi:hypothetical protein
MIELVRAGRTPEELAKEFEPTAQAIRNWVAQADRNEGAPISASLLTRNAPARAVFFHRLGEIRDRAFENQRYRDSGLNLAVAAIVLWNTVYLGRAVFRAKKQFSSGVVEGLNNKAKLTMRKAYGFRTFRVTEIALYHALAKLPEFY